MNKTENKFYYKKKLSILEDAKKHIIRDGWSKNIFNKISKNKLKKTDLIFLFPNGYMDLLILALNEINTNLENKIKKINIINFPLSKRIKKILLFRLEILNKDKIFYKKTFNHLLLPANSKLLKKCLYNSVDKMWYLAGDNSTDFSFYTKRIILAFIYTSAIFTLNNYGLERAEENIDKNLQKIAKIPKIKERFSFIKDNLPIFIRSFIN